MLAELIKPRETAFAQDRLNTVGASEIGLCARRTWFKKREQPEDTPRDGWGYRERGHNVEAWVVERLGVTVTQHFVHRGFLSATVDIVWNGEPVDVKSFDPRLRKLPKHEHVMQARQQAFLMGAPHGHLLYVNCSDYQDMREFSFTAADYSERARAIMTGPMPMAEGRLVGECDVCPFQVACLGEPIADRGTLSETDEAALAAARDEHDRAAAVAAAAKERIRDILRAADVRRAPGIARVSRRSTLDTEAMERDGIDLSKYRKPTEAVVME